MVARDRFLVRSLPVPRFAFARVAISLAMSLSEQGVPTPGNMALNLDMVNDMIGGVQWAKLVQWYQMKIGNDS